jgi:hypothetical protein
MQRDIDDIIAAIQQRLPDAEVEQLRVTHAADDDGIWYFKLPHDTKDISLESSLGTCQFLVEHSDSPAPTERSEHAQTADEAVERVVAYLETRLRASV